jgi:membrane associated rhomboid family serine protease
VIIPLNHENMHGRRWPYVTIAIVALNTIFFLATHWKIESETRQLGEIQEHVILLAAVHPGTPMTPEERKLVETFRQGQPKAWEQITSPQRRPEDFWDLQMRDWESARCEEEMTLLGGQLSEAQHESVLMRYAFYPSRRSPITFLTANFLHGGWLHLIFNMWFLWLAGTILEDKWGRPLYSAFYLISGAAALMAYGLVYPNGLIPVIGASGAIAALMGAFLVRFPKTEIQLGFFYWIIRPRLYRFNAPAYVVLPLWLIEQLFSGMLAGQSAGVAYWAHIGGFGFGLAAAFLLRFTGIEHKADQAIEAKVSWSADPRIVKAGELLEKNHLDAAIAELKAHIVEKPGSADAHEMLPSIYWRKGDVPAHLQAIEAACAIHLKLRNTEAAWQDYEDYRKAGGAKMPPATWLELCRLAENDQKWERAFSEYENLATAWPTDRVSVLALISAARIQLKQLGQRDLALRFYTAAQNSPVPHQEWNETIRKGMEACRGSGQPQPATPSSYPV